MSLSASRTAVLRLHNAGRLAATNNSGSRRGLATQADAEVAPKPIHMAPTTENMTWPEYLAIRRSRKRWETTATVPGGLLGFTAGIGYFGSLETDPLKPIMGLDPFMAYGMFTVACLGVGAIAGPSIGGALWRMRHRHQLAAVDEKDKEFLHHIAKNRVDASLQSPTAPVPDYYGERIGSLHQYRQWLRDQNKYRRKVLLPEKED
ncbi:presequence translocated-associated motor subunit PAM17 [Coprinopsis sp. MPI-PUGE-AT-0042]|nr:presequence translocated-associated motor subunit PAM17 [Coprinopsis sp. MPI-PUGE-AT-0042]